MCMRAHTMIRSSRSRKKPLNHYRRLESEAISAFGWTIESFFFSVLV